MVFNWIWREARRNKANRFSSPRQRGRFCRKPFVEQLEERILLSVDSYAKAMYNDLSEAQYSLTSDPTGQTFVNEYKLDLVADVVAPLANEFQSVNPYQPIVNFLDASVPDPLATILDHLHLPTSPAGFLHNYLKDQNPDLDSFLSFIEAPSDLASKSLDQLSQEGFKFPDLANLLNDPTGYQGTAMNDLVSTAARPNALVTYTPSFQSQKYTIFQTDPIGIPPFGLAVGGVGIGLTASGSIDASIGAQLSIGYDSQGFFLDPAASNPFFTLTLEPGMQLDAGIDASQYGIDPSETGISAHLGPAHR